MSARRVSYLMLFFLSVIFELINKNKLKTKIITSASFFLFWVIILTTHTMELKIFNPFIAIFLIFLLMTTYFIKRSFDTFNIFKNGKEYKAVVCSFSKEKKRKKGRSYYVNYMNYEIQYNGSNYKFKDVVMSQEDFRNETDSQLEFKFLKNKKSTEKPTTLKEFIVFSNGDINRHVFKNGYFHILYDNLKISLLKK